MADYQRNGISLWDTLHEGVKRRVVTYLFPCRNWGELDSQWHIVWGKWWLKKISLIYNFLIFLLKSFKSINKLKKSTINTCIPFTLIHQFCHIAFLNSLYIHTYILHIHFFCWAMVSRPHYNTSPLNISMYVS